MKSVYIETYGCQMNVHDSERISGLLEEAGMVRAPEPIGEMADADVVVFNTNDPDCTRAMAEELNGHLKADVKLHNDPKLFLPSSACDEYLASSRIQLTYT